MRESKKRKTSVKERTHHAVWNEGFKFPVDLSGRQALTCTLYDHDMLGGDDQLGR